MAEINRYSDTVPYEKRRYWYLTSHGTGPGTIPDDLKILEILEYSGGDFICLDGILNTSELEKYDMKEQSPPKDVYVDRKKKKNGIFAEVWEENNEIKVQIDWGDWKHEHLRCDYLMGEIGYELQSTVTTEEDGSDCYSALHTYIEEKQQ